VSKGEIGKDRKRGRKRERESIRRGEIEREIGGLQKSLAEAKMCKSGLSTTAGREKVVHILHNLSLFKSSDWSTKK